MKKLIITAAITGAETTKQMNPNLPTTPKEQARSAARCAKTGAAVIHLHVRDKDGRPSQSIDDFENVIEEIYNACPNPPIIQISTGGAVGVSMEKRMAPVAELRPEMASLNVRTMEFGDEMFVNEPEDVLKLAKLMKEHNVIPEVEVYNFEDIEVAENLLNKGLLSRPIHYQFVLGVPKALNGEKENLTKLLSLIKPEDSWGVAGIGRYETPLAKLAVEMGGYVRVGFEDNIYYEKGVLAKSNAQLVNRVVEFANSIGREIATPDEARKMLGIIQE